MNATKVKLVLNRLERYHRPFPKIRYKHTINFNHELTRSGKLVLNDLTNSLTSRYNNWKYKTQEYYAPIVSLCQGYGSGKTKIAIECLKRNPGFYLNLRNESTFYYPFTNGLSLELRTLIMFYNDPITGVYDVHYTQSTIGKIADFFARIVTTYIRNVVSKSKSKIMSSNMTEDQAVQDAIHDMAKLFERNESVDANFNLINKEEMQKIYQRYYSAQPIYSFYDGTRINENSVGLVTTIIKRFLEDPQICLSDPSDPASQAICEILEKKFKYFPFLFVLDEADILSKIKVDQSQTAKIITGFDVLRRALGYTERTARVMFLTLGADADVINYYDPCVLGKSIRFSKFDCLLEPITLNSNSNIFSLEYPITKIQPSYKLLQNPLMFKFLCTLGHALWGILPFNTTATFAYRKMRNDSDSSTDHLLPVWMIRTGIAAHPLHEGTKSLVANHMATLLNVRKDAPGLMVSYPSDPILAMSARSLINYCRDETLFKVLKKNIEALDVDIGNYGKIFASMIVLRAIDLAPDRTPRSSYSERLEEIEALVPHFRSLWHKKTHLLEPDSGATDPNRHCDFLFGYKICTVEDFLDKFTDFRFDLKEKLPQSILEGIVNASHMVNLTRDKGGFYGFKKRDLPSADPRIKNNSRNVVDAELLKTGLLRQCGFILPINYYGLDFIIPVCLKNDQVTFIGIKVKQSDANTEDDAYKMQSRFHFVNCLNCEKFGDTKCSKCTYDHEGLKEIYANSVSLLISLDDYDNFAPFQSTREFNLKPKSFSKKVIDKNNTKLLETLQPNLPTRFKLDKLNLKGESSSFFKPLAQEIERIDDGMALIKSVWIDKYVKIESDEEMPFNNDGFVHRQFCIATRGWEIFEHLFFEADKCYLIANEIMSSEGLFKKCIDRSDSKSVRKVLHDTSPTYFQFDDELWSKRDGD